MDTIAIASERMVESFSSLGCPKLCICSQERESDEDSGQRVKVVPATKKLQGISLEDLSTGDLIYFKLLEK